MRRIGDYGFISDSQSGALISSAGSVDWLCFPRFDSPSIFGRLLDRSGGSWTIAPAGSFESERTYDGDSLVLLTRFRTSGGLVEVVDALAFAPGATGHEIGLRSPHVLVREVRGVEGTVDMLAEATPRPEYALTRPRFGRAEDGAVEGVAGADTLRFTADVPLEVMDEESLVRSAFTVSAGERVAFSLQWRRTFGERPGELPKASELLEGTRRGWRTWAEQHWGGDLGYRGPYMEEVRRSALVLQGLTYQPSGAVSAALTTSLPERPGRDWNWDYRYGWLRDCSFMVRALWIAACPDEPEALFRWIAAATGRNDGSAVQIVYGLEGERDLTERLLMHLEGYGNSKPVRIGNDAWRQRQLDVLGEVLDAALQLDEKLEYWSPESRELLAGFADHTVANWRHPDAGMWEARDRNRHYTSSKIMCWVALDRALRLADRLAATEAQRAAWYSARDDIHRAVLLEAWSDEQLSLTGALGSHELDASVLLAPLVGFLPPNDPRVRLTIDTINRELGAGRGLIRRWSSEPVGFMLASYWMVSCLAVVGDVERAKERFELVTACANDLGLLAEEADPRTGEPLGNTPQAFSHVGLINAAWDIAEAERRLQGKDDTR